MNLPRLETKNTASIAPNTTSTTSAYSAKMPPSPWLLARMAMRTCFVVISRVIVQITSDSEPMTSSCEVCAGPPLPSMIDFMTYIGEVPMSPDF